MKMRSWAAIAVGVLLCSAVNGQAPFALDPTFQTQIVLQYVSSALPLEDGTILVSGRMRFAGETDDRFVAKLFSSGLRDTTFPQVPGGYIDGGGKLTLWDGRFYVATNTAVRRYWLDGSIDYSFIHPDLGPYFSSLQGGDYHVFPDGRLVMSGVHLLEDSIRGFMGYHNFIWFTNTGYLDTTRIHRWGDGAIFRFKELPDGKFICSGTNTTFEGQPVDRVFRLNPDGSLDDSFQSDVFWGEVYGYLPLDDGRIYVGGRVRRNASPSDTLRLVRFMPDGSLDPSFSIPDLTLENMPDASGLGAMVRSIQPYPGNKIIVTGVFRAVNGQPRKGLCMLTESGDLLDVFHDQGVGTYTYQNITYGGVEGIRPYGDDQYLIWGNYHGYNDEELNAPQQKYVTRLHAGDLVTAVSTAEAIPSDLITLYPNPASAWVAINYDLLTGLDERTWLRLKDAVGRELQSVQIKDTKGQVVLDTRVYGTGVYTLELVKGERVVQMERLVVQ